MNHRSWIWIGYGFVWLLLLTGTGRSLAQETPDAETPTKKADPQATATRDRLAAPATVIPPTQADDGAQLYWLWCQPCHGDQGQGLTDEWREQYPEEDRNCWGSRCHGNHPYEDGFTLPLYVPALIGDQSLARFRTMDELYNYIHINMPYEFPGALSEEEALSITAFLARAHGKWDGTRLTIENTGQFRWQPSPTVTPSAATKDEGLQDLMGYLKTGGLSPGNVAIIIGGLLIGFSLVGGVYLWKRRQ